MSREEEESHRKREKDRLNLVEKNVIVLKNKLMNIKCTALPSSNSSTTFRQLTKKKRERTQAEKREWEADISWRGKGETVGRERKKKKIKMESALTSTPSFHTRRGQDETSSSPIDISPIKVFDLSRDVVDPEAYGSMELSENDSAGSIKRTQMSDDLSKLFIEPRSERESQELLKILKQTLELTRAAIERGVIRMCLSDPDLRQPLNTNIFRGAYRRARSFSLSEEMKNLNIDMWESDDLLEENSGWPTATIVLTKSCGVVETLNNGIKRRRGLLKNLTVQAIRWEDEMKHFLPMDGNKREALHPKSLTYWHREKEGFESGGMRGKKAVQQEMSDAGSPNLRKRKPMDTFGLPMKIMTPEATREINKKIIHMEIDEEEEVGGPKGGVSTPITERKKITPRRRIPSLGRKKKCEKKIDASQRLISANKWKRFYDVFMISFMKIRPFWTQFLMLVGILIEAKPRTQKQNCRQAWRTDTKWQRGL